MLLLRDEHIREAMNRVDITDELEQMLSRSVEGGLELPPRLTIDAKGNQGFLRLMPVIAYDTGYAGYKAMNYHPLHGVRYLIALTSLETGELEAMLDADWITAQRTAVTAAIAVRKLAPDRADRLVVIGSGTQARALLEATARVLRPAVVQVYSPTVANREQFAATMSAQLEIDIEPVDVLEPALRQADIVLSAFRADTEPVLHLHSIRPGALVCGISSVRSHHREVDAELWRASRVVVDDLEHVCESGDGRAVELGTDASDVSELWQVLQRPELGRRSQDERVLFKSVGTAEQDIALAAIVLQRARTLGLGDQLGEFPSTRPIQASSVVAASA